MEYPVLLSAIPQDDFSLALTFSNGEHRKYDFKPNLTHKFYRPLADLKLFKMLSVEDGELEWATGQDFCPNTLYENSEILSDDIATPEDIADIEQARKEYAAGETVPHSAVNWD